MASGVIQKNDQAPDSGTAESGASSRAAEDLKSFSETTAKVCLTFLLPMTYMSMRAQMNYLGAPLTSDLGVEGYLREVYSFVFDVITTLTVVFLAALALGIVSTLSWKLISRIRPTAALTGTRAIRQFGTGVWAPISVMLVLICAFLFVLRFVSHNVRVDVAVGVLDDGALAGTLNRNAFDGLLIVCLSGFLLSRWAATASIGPKQARLWKGSTILVGLLMFYLPMLHGLTVRSSDFPVALLYSSVEGTAPLCGLKVLETSRGLTLWRAVNRMGSMHFVPHSEIKTVVVSRAALLPHEALDAARDGTTHPSCSE